ncbi:hypothetical protein [Pseudomonas mandelii]|uniref:hypothetical protein n=1 Tax=Pseudomonas mandelii TaxID=75612 RepID=UPI0020A22E1F|nr:hypothetical protein [Pseudomonas mandelii]MCO8312549.1 hypothetical protein [Pseudomonas mandelii]
MNSDHTPQGEHVEALLQALERDSDALLKFGMQVVGPSGSPMFPLDWMVFAAIKRGLSTASAVTAMVRAWNMVCARSLLRMHIDTALRFSAAWLVSEPHAFATRVFEGARIDKLTDRNGKRLTDAYLVEMHKNEHPWLPDVYANLSGYVHFSGSHINDAISHFVEEDRTIEFLISDSDLKFPEFSWVEILECFREATSILARHIQGYAHTKKFAPDALEALRGRT